MSGPAVPAFRAAARFPAIRLYNHVVPVLISAAVIAATACGFISVAPNRLVSGEPVALWLAADPRVTAALAVLGAALLTTAVATSNRAAHFVSAGIAVFLVFLVQLRGGPRLRMRRLSRRGEDQKNQGHRDAC